MPITICNGVQRIEEKFQRVEEMKTRHDVPSPNSEPHGHGNNMPSNSKMVYLLHGYTEIPNQLVSSVGPSGLRRMNYKCHQIAPASVSCKG
jgi:hypothetical protein